MFDRREILFDYEQYEYHGTSVSKMKCREKKSFIHFGPDGYVAAMFETFLFAGGHDVFWARLGPD